MKRTDFLTKLISVLLFLAIVSYLGVYLLRSLTNDVRTAPAVYVSLTQSVDAPGIVVREEKLIMSDRQHLSVVAENGALLSSGQTIAVAYSGQEALSRAAEIKELEIKKAYIQSVLSEYDDTGSLADRDENIADALTELSAACTRQESDRLSAAALSLSSLVMDNLDVNTTQVDLNLVTQQLDRLKAAALGDTAAITAPASGLFSTAPDGYEFISPDVVSALKPGELRTLISQPQELGQEVMGKLVEPYEWFFVSIMSLEDSQRLNVGGRAQLDFGRYCSSVLTSQVESISAPQEGECTVVFRCTASTGEMLSVRRATAEVVFSTTQGIRVPKEAVRSDDGGPYVYTLTGLQAEKKYLTIVWEAEEYFLADSSRDAAALRVGNEIILTRGEIYDGKLMK